MHLCLCALVPHRFSVSVFLLGLMIWLAEARVMDGIEERIGMVINSVFSEACEECVKVIKEFS